MSIVIDTNSDHYQFLIKVFANTVLIVGDVDSWEAKLRTELLTSADLISLGLGGGDFPFFLLDSQETWLAVYQGMYQLECIIQHIPDNTPLSLLSVLGYGDWVSLKGMKESATVLREWFLRPENFPDLKNPWLKLLEQYPSMACHSCCGQRVQVNLEKSAFYGDNGSTFEWFDISSGVVADYLVDENHLTDFKFNHTNHTYSIRSQNLIF